ncbi:unnamed protein product [Fraxinus pennsylvanica]|uniref:Uncharacterized protein n=1 Tax=Fraxinus pennsylvanica TaxID=56036 RepID=A0AAD1YRJ0_9LAMI|nr:unnamed protein product [Fraxinus pennsylvanica]
MGIKGLLRNVHAISVEKDLHSNKNQIYMKMSSLWILAGATTTDGFKDGEATCETYLKSKVYHNTMENYWDLQAVPIVLRSPLPGMFSSLGTDRILSNHIESSTSLKSVPIRQPILTTSFEELQYYSENNLLPEIFREL